MCSQSWKRRRRQETEYREKDVLSGHIYSRLRAAVDVDEVVIQEAIMSKYTDYFVDVKKAEGHG